MNPTLLASFRQLTPLPQNVVIEKLNPYLYPSYILALDGLTLTAVKKNNINEVETYIGNLIHSSDYVEVLAGYLNVIFWGFLGNSKNNSVNLGRAFGKAVYTGFLVKGENLKGQIIASQIQLEEIFNCIQEIKHLVAERRFDEAVIKSTGLRGLGFSFATKLLMFIDPINCAVLDAVIARKMIGVRFSWDGVALSKRKPNPETYQAYCIWLHQTLQKIEGMRLTRAVDLERQLFYS